MICHDDDRSSWLKRTGYVSNPVPKNVEKRVFVFINTKQLYFFSGFNSGPVYHLRVVERFAPQNLCFVFKLIKLKLNL